jgi:hypothetical protein
MGYSYDFNQNFSSPVILTIFGGILGLASLALRYCYTSSCDINFCFGCLHFEREQLPNPVEPPVEESKSQDNVELSNKKNNIIYNKV